VSEPTFQALEAFGFEPARLRATRVTGGHIHASFRIELAADDSGDRDPRLPVLLQRLHLGVFPDPHLLMENMVRVTEHLNRSVTGRGLDPARHALEVLPAPSGESYLRVGDQCWRMLRWIPGTESLFAPDSEHRAFRAARAFGELLCDLDSLDPSRVGEPIPHFHDTPRRCRALDDAVRADPLGRVADAAAVIERLERHRDVASRLFDLERSGDARRRVVHNDAKLPNVLFDEETGEAQCIVDLDTVMPGQALFDFGDLARSMSSRSPEDAPDPEAVEIDRPIVEAMVAGYLESAGPVLSAAERAHLHDAALVLTYQQAVRFLTDHLLGDHYFRIPRPGQNLHRARVQLALLEALLEVPELFRG
jgi:Ser/Thr protein kinase RdoA (MazF antagonist)